MVAVTGDHEAVAKQSTMVSLCRGVQLLLVAMGL
jgi:gamma-glutamyl-gamma-aminobutyrate hydrolase PuuD